MTVEACHCVKSVQIQRFLWSEYKKIRTRKKLRIWTLFKQCISIWMCKETSSNLSSEICRSAAYWWVCQTSMMEAFVRNVDRDLNKPLKIWLKIRSGVNIFMVLSHSFREEHYEVLANNLLSCVFSPLAYCVIYHCTMKYFSKVLWLTASN